MSYREPPANAPLILFGSKVVAVDRATGKKLWEHSTDGRLVQSFVFEGDRLFVLDDLSVLHCLVANTGQSMARVELELIERIMLDEGRLYGVGGNWTIALDLDGRILWKQEIDLDMSSEHSLPGMAIPGGASLAVDYSRR